MGALLFQFRPRTDRAEEIAISGAGATYTSADLTKH